MTEIPLPALDGTSALGYLAALGVLRLVSECDPTARLTWDQHTSRAEIHADQLTDLDDVVALLTDVIESIPPGSVIPHAPADFPPLRGDASKLRLDPSAITALASSLRHDDHETAVTWLSSLATDLALDKNGKASLSSYVGISGQQTLRTMLAKPLASIRSQPEQLREALVHWRRYEGITGEYLDHRVLYDSAATPDGNVGQERGVPGATWLALMSYPLVRTTSVTGTRPISSGWFTVGRRTLLRWPLWSPQLDLDAIRVLWEHPLLTEVAQDTSGTEAAATRLSAMGVFAVHIAGRWKLDGRNSAGVLAPAAAIRLP